MERTASAVWSGGLKDGKGTISTQSGTLKSTQYSFGTRFENGTGTNPEELIAAAHAGCFTMALSAQLGQANLTPESLETSASVKFEKTDAGFTITAIHLVTRAKVPGASESATVVEVKRTFLGTVPVVASTLSQIGRLVVSTEKNGNGGVSTDGAVIRTST